MDFRTFLRPYMRSVSIKERSEGSYINGVWVPGEEKSVSFRAAITSFSDDALQFGETGTYTIDDRKIFTYKKLKRGQKIEIDEPYTITDERDYSFYAKGLRMYVGRRDGIAHD